MKISARELVLLLATLLVALFAGSVLLVLPRFEQFRSASARLELARGDIVDFQELIAQRADWERQFDELKSWLPQFPEGKDMQTHWLSVMDKAAEKHGLVIGRRQSRPEERIGDIYELPIECRDWEGVLEGLVRFMFDLQAEGAMLDLRQVFVRATEGGGLRGSFTLYCAYTRGGSGGAPNPEAGAN